MTSEYEDHRTKIVNRAGRLLNIQTAEQERVLTMLYDSAYRHGHDMGSFDQQAIYEEISQNEKAESEPTESVEELEARIRELEGLSILYRPIGGKAFEYADLQGQVHTRPRPR